MINNTKIKENLKYILAIPILVLIGWLICNYYAGNNNNNIKIQKENLVKEEKKEVTISLKDYYVDIKGAVKTPGVYKLKENSRVIDVINEAGGLNDDADTSIINLSKKIFDEMFIVIYTKDEIKDYKTKTISTKEINNQINKNIVVIDENNDANIKNSSKLKEENNENKIININTASKDELLLITGIGESKALAIISYRKEKGDFKQIEDIKNVSGIGDALFEKIKNYITV